MSYNAVDEDCTPLNRASQDSSEGFVQPTSPPVLKSDAITNDSISENINTTKVMSTSGNGGAHGSIHSDRSDEFNQVTRLLSEEVKAHTGKENTTYANPNSSARDKAEQKDDVEPSGPGGMRRVASVPTSTSSTSQRGSEAALSRNGGGGALRSNSVDNSSVLPLPPPPSAATTNPHQIGRYPHQHSFSTSTTPTAVTATPTALGPTKSQSIRGMSPAVLGRSLSGRHVPPLQRSASTGDSTALTTPGTPGGGGGAGAGGGGLAPSTSTRGISPAVSLFSRVAEVVLPVTNTAAATTDRSSLSKGASQRDIESGLLPSVLEEDETVDIIETFNCKICFENRALSDKFCASTCEFKETHTYCLPCMSSYVSIQVEDGVVDHYCPGVSECHAQLNTDELRILLFPEAFDRLQRLTQVKKNPLFRECPKCNTGINTRDVSLLGHHKQSPPKDQDMPSPQLEEVSLASPTKAVATAGEIPPSESKSQSHTQSGDTNDDSPAAPGTAPGATPAQIICPKCNYEFCFYHNDAHPGQSCADYARNQSRRARAENEATEKLINTETKACPNCKSPTEKAGGCNHMTCQNCHADWCWLCGRRIVDGVGNHYRAGNLEGCPGGQFGDRVRRLRRIDVSTLCFGRDFWKRIFSGCLCVVFLGTGVNFMLGLLELFVVMLVSCCVGCGCMCACCPLGICLGYGRYYHYTYRIPHGPDDPKPPCIAFVHETLGLCFAVPMLLMMMLVDVILLPWMALLYMVAFVWYRCTAGAAGVGRLFRDEDGGPVPVCDALGDYLASLSVVFRFIHRMQ